MASMLRRFGVKAAIVAAGGVIAVGSINRATYLPRTPLAKRMVAEAPASPLPTPWGTTRSADSAVAPGGLDAGMDHDRIKYWVKRLSTTMGHDFVRQLGRKSKYEEMITAKLEAKQMPHDLIYLAMIESEFNPNAKSPVKAVGMWQFMSATAKRFGLTVKGRVDERKDPARATDAAVAYLSDLHDRFGSWYLAAAAYNSGEGTVLKALRATTGKSKGTDEDFFKILPMLPKETQDYVPKLIAAARVGNAPERYGLDPMPKAEAAGGDVASPAGPAVQEGLAVARSKSAKPGKTAKSSNAAKPSTSRHVTPKAAKPTKKSSKASRTRAHLRTGGVKGISR
jgi:membrane-bound lytic murein transglycosylase D